ncbi:MAG: hypothetical protein Q9160_003833 [Pyrenula sp. 1 TL-2023]
MVTPETRLKEVLGYEQVAGSKPVVCLPGFDARASMVGHGPMVDSLPPLYGQPVPLFPPYARPSGTDLVREAYIAKSEVKKHDITARGTKGSKWRRDNALQNELMKDKRDKWWRSQRLERAARRGSPWGTQVNLHEVKVRMPGKGRTRGNENEENDGAVSSPMRPRNPRGSEAESFLEWFQADRFMNRRTMRAPLRSIVGNDVPGVTITAPSDGSEALLEHLPPVDLPDADPLVDSHHFTLADTQFTDTSLSHLLSSFPFLPSSHLLPIKTKRELSRGSLEVNSKSLISNIRALFSDTIADSMANQRHVSRPGPKKGPTTSMTSSHEYLKASWRQRPFLDLKVGPVSPETSTLDIWHALHSKGHINSINLWNDLGRHATVRFRPPPEEDFFTAEPSYIFIPSDHYGQYRATVRIKPGQRSNFEVNSPVRRNVTYPETIELRAESIDFGAHVRKDTMTILRSLRGTYTQPVKLVLNLRRKQIEVHFFANVDGKPRHFRFIVAFEDLSKITQFSTGRYTSLILHLPGPPPYFKFLQDQIPRTHESKSPTWKDEDAWFRQTSIERDQDHIDNLKSAPANLKKLQATIDIGRWTSYRLTFNDRAVDMDAFRNAADAFQDFNVTMDTIDTFTFSRSDSTVFDHIDVPSNTAFAKRQSSFEAALVLPPQAEFPLSFPVRYQLEVCLSNNSLCEFGMGREFLSKLSRIPEKKALRLLEHVASLKKRFYDPMDIFDLDALKLPRMRINVPTHCNVMRTAVVTATTIVYSSPSVEMTNRVIRQFHFNVDRFLRVRFEDDKFRGNAKIYATQQSNTFEIFTRIKRVLTNGITLGDRHYEFVAFGNSQLREHAAYFFASSSYLSAHHIRAWLGSFDKEKIVAKHAARMGQCFSTTRAILGTRMQRPRETTLIPDIKRGNYIFSDGVGKMSPFVANLIASELGLNLHGQNAPSCYQFRLGGCKGVLATSPDLKHLQLEIRRSQFKFDTQHHGLEIIRWSQYWTASLNKQLILVLSFLGVEDHIFLSHQEHLVQLLEKAMCDDEAAREGLQASVDPNRMTLTLSSLVTAGFRTANDPFVTSCLRLWRAWSIKYLKEKAKIPVRKGACILGVVDETATLGGHFSDRVPNGSASQQQKEDALPEIFIQITRPDTGELEVVTGKCILARNPSLHPGDIRVVRAVGVKALEHHRDVVVLPQTGDRDLSSMCSGGDLDGDDYVVIWDQDFLPKVWFYEPMDYTPPEPQRVQGEVTTNDITTFFVNYMRQDFLGRIATAHLALADDPQIGLAHPDCLTLVDLHSQAVDFPKTGVPARFPRELMPRQWPHFMERKGRQQQQIRKSNQILGQLFDAVERVKFVPNYDGSFDQRILSAYQPDKETLEAAQKIKQEYDEAMQRIMAQHEIQSEFEVWTTFVLDHSQATGDFKFHEQIGRLSTDLKDRFRKACVEQAGGKHSVDVAFFATAMYQVTQMQLEKALSEVKAGERSRSDMPFISFPWLMQHTLSDIAKGLHHWTKPPVNEKAIADHSNSEEPIEDSEVLVTHGLVLSEDDKRRLLAERTGPIPSRDFVDKENIKEPKPAPQMRAQNHFGFGLTQGPTPSGGNKKGQIDQRRIPVSSEQYERAVESRTRLPDAGPHPAPTDKLKDDFLISVAADDRFEKPAEKVITNRSRQDTNYSSSKGSELELLEREFSTPPSGFEAPANMHDMIGFDQHQSTTKFEAKEGPRTMNHANTNSGIDWLTSDYTNESNVLQGHFDELESGDEIFEDAPEAKASALDTLEAMNARMR